MSTFFMMVWNELIWASAGVIVKYNGKFYKSLQDNGSIMDGWDPNTPTAGVVEPGTNPAVWEEVEICDYCHTNHRVYNAEGDYVGTCAGQEKLGEPVADCDGFMQRM